MGKVLRPGIDNSMICTPKDAVANGYISGTNVSSFIMETVIGGTYKDKKDVEKHRECFDYVKETVDKFKFGAGHSVKYYYDKNQVVSAVANYINNGGKKPKEQVYTKEELKKMGYFSGTVVGDNLYKHLKHLGFTGTELQKVYQKEMNNLRKTVSKKTIGEGKATKHYYDLVGVNDFMFNLTERYENR